MSVCQLPIILNSIRCAKKYGYKPDDDVKEYLSENFETIIDINKENFANAREVRNLFENILVAQADRLLTYP